MGFLSRILDDVIHPFGLGQHQQQAPQQSRPAPAVTPPPGNNGGLSVSTAPNNQQIDVAPPPQHVINPAIQFATPTVQPDLRVSAAPAPTLLNTTGQPVQAAAPAPPPPPQPEPSLGSRLLNTLHNDVVAPIHRDVISPVNSAVVKPVTNTVMGDIVYPTVSGIAGLEGDPTAAAIAQEEAAKAQAGSLPQILAKPIASLGEGLAYAPKAIYRELQNKPITDVQQRLFGTTDPGTIAKEIAGNTAAAELTVAAPGTSKLVDGAAAPVLNSIEDPITARLAAAGVRATTQAPVGAAYNASSTLASDPNASAKDLEHAATSGALLFAAGASAPDLVAAAAEGTPKLITYAQEHSAEIRSNQTGAVGKNVNEPTPPEPQQPSPIDLNKNLTSQLDNARGAAGQPVPAAPPDVQEVIDGARSAIKAGDINRANTLAETLPDKYAKPLIDELANAPMPDSFLANELDNARGAAGQPKKTGVADKQLQDLQSTHDQIIKAEADTLRPIHQPAAALNEVSKKVRDNGGISSSAYEDLPKGVIRKGGVSADVMARDLGYNNEDELVNALQTESEAKANTLNETQLREKALENLQNGKGSYQSDFNNVKEAIANRQNELSLYPKGTRAQVKVNDKAPAAMSEAELASLAKQPEAQIKPAGNKITPPADNALRNGDAERTALEGLKKGATTDDILTQYQKDTGVTLQKAVKDVNRVASEAGIETSLGKNPISPEDVKLPQIQKGDFKQVTRNARFVMDKEQEMGASALDKYNALKPEDQMLLKKIEDKPVSEVAKDATNPEDFTAAAQALRTYFDTRHAYDTHLGIDVGYRTNYIRHFFDKAAEEGDAALTGDEQMRGGGANKTPGYTKARTVENLAKNVGDALERDINSSSFNHAKLAYENGLNDAFPGKISNGELARSANDGTYTQIKHPFGRDLSAPDSIAKEINRRVWIDDAGKLEKGFDTFNHSAKYLKLAGGLFHANTEATNFLGTQIMNGKAFKDPGASAGAFKAFFSEKAMAKNTQRMADSGKLDDARLAGLKIKPKEVMADVNINSLDQATSKLAKATGIQQMHDATFQREIPYAKLKLFEQNTEGLDRNNPADMTHMVKVAKAVNGLFGGIDRESDGITPKWFKILQKGVLATDFTEAKLTTLAKAITDRGIEGKIARQAVAGKVLLSAIVATSLAGVAGDYQGKTKGQVAKDAAGNLVDPSFEMGGYKVGLPKTHVSEVVDALKPTQKNGKAWNASGVISYAQNRTAAAPSEIISLLNNKNYYGQPLYGTNTKKNGGGKISTPQAGLNIAQTALPIPFGQVTNTVSGKQNPAAAAANILGFKAKPNPDNTVTFQGVNATMNDKQTAAYQTALKNNTDKITSQLTNSADFKALSPNDQAKALSNLKSNITSATQRDFASKNGLGQFAPNFSGKETKASTKEQDILSGNINPNAYLPSNNASSNNDSAAVAAFKKGNDKLTTIGDQTYYKKGDGTVAHKNTFEYQNAIKTADLSFTMDRAKAGDNYNAWTDAANQRLDQLQTMLGHYDPQTEPDKIDAIKKEAADLTDQMQKYNSYGGNFTKPPKGRKGGSTNGISYKFFNPTSYEKSLRSLLDAARVS